MHVPDDATLAIRSLYRDQQAYAMLIDRYKNTLYGYCFAATDDEDQAQDLTRQTFVAAYYKLGSYNPEHQPFKNWLLDIAANISKDKQQATTTPESPETTLTRSPSHPLPEDFTSGIVKTLSTKND